MSRAPDGRNCRSGRQSLRVHKRGFDVYNYSSGLIAGVAEALIPNVQNLLVAAVRCRRRLKLNYDGQGAVRVVEPHIVYTSEENLLTLLAYQIRGYHSSRREGSFWRPFQVRKIEQIAIMDELFEPRIEAGFFKLAAMLKGRVQQRVEEAGDYTYLNTEVYGPPVPKRVN